MRTWRSQWSRWWTQRQLDALYFTTHRQGLWGVHGECLESLGEHIQPHLAKTYTGESLKLTLAPLHAPTIDVLVSDMHRMAETIVQEQYVDERLVYSDREPRHLHAFLTHRDGYALPVDLAFTIFHQQALRVAQAMDGLHTTEDESSDAHYYLRRYRGLLEEILTVYDLFASLAQLHLPALQTQ